MPPLSRRTLLRTALASLATPGLLAQRSRPRRRAQAKRVLLLFEQGGVSQMDTFDPKPELPVEHRSPFAEIKTNVPGMRFTELCTKTARHADKLTVVRCMHQPTPGIGNSHPMGSRYVMSGVAPGGPVEMPDLGSVVAHLLGTEAPHLPPYVMVPGNHEQAAESSVGFLPAAVKAFKTGGSDLSAPDWRVPDLRLLDDVGSDRFARRDALLQALEEEGKGDSADAMLAAMAQAREMLTNPKTLAAFDLSAESDAVRAAYGRGHRGSCYLLGRKLIESGVRFVLVDVREPMTKATPGGSNMNWDHHDYIYSEGSTQIEGGGPGAGRYGIHTWPMMGSTDQAFAALLDDLEQRGLLDETLVCFMTEFGRTPKINNRKGRDHWTHAFTCVFAGAGVPGGQVVGETGKDGGYITSPMAYRLEDFAATVLEKLGIDRSKPIYTPEDRPIFLAHTGEPIPELMG